MDVEKNYEAPLLIPICCNEMSIDYDRLKKERKGYKKSKNAHFLDENGQKIGEFSFMQKT